MIDRLKQIPARAMEWWKKYNTKQKAILLSIAAVVIVGLVILGVVLSKPKMVVLKECENTKEASDIQNLLRDNDIKFEVSNDGLVFSVRAEDEATATILLGENNITAYGYEWENLNNVFSGGFSATEGDKGKKYKLYMEEDLAEKLKSLAAVEDARVTLNVPEDNGTLISRNEPSYAWVVLDLNSELEESVSQGLGRAIATALGTENTDNITILDSRGNTLFAGGESDSSVGSANNNLELKSKAETQVANEVRKAIMETNLYSSVSVVPNLDIEYKESTVTDREVYPARGQEDKGLPSSERDYSNNATGGAAAAPGTDANDNTGYVVEDGAVTSQEITDHETTYDNSERVTNEKITSGRPNYETSSLAVVASKYQIYNERDMREDGLLDGTTFDEFVEANGENRPMEVDPTLVTMVANATGIAEENISIVAYEVPFFEYAKDESRNFMDYLPIVLAALIMLMLGFVVFRSTRREAEEPVAEMEPELSVEALLESTKEAEQSELEDIGFTEKSEIRVLIEKFVDENPEAAASLLRNWLNEEWE